jgi:hypothetical protein
MVFIRFNGDTENIHSERKYSFRPVEGMKPIAVPEGYFLLDFKIRTGYTDEGIYDSVELPVVSSVAFLRDTTTFSICFDRTGKLAVTNVRIFADYDADGASTDSLFNDWDHYNTGDADQSGTAESYETVLLCADEKAAEGLGGEQSRMSVRIANQNDYDNYNEAPKYFYFSALPQYHAGIWTGKLMRN